MIVGDSELLDSVKLGRSQELVLKCVLMIESFLFLKLVENDFILNQNSILKMSEKAR